MTRSLKMATLCLLFLPGFLTSICQPALATNPVDSAQSILIDDKHPAHKKRFIHFPNISIGEVQIAAIADTPSKRSFSAAARGTVIVPPESLVTFIPNHRYYRDPNVGKSVDAKSIDVLIMPAMSLDDSEDGLCDKALAAVGHFTDLLDLKLDRSDATDAGAQFAAQLPQLQRLSCFMAGLNGYCFKYFSGLKKLRAINANDNHIRDQTLQYLPAIQNLQHLSLAHNSLSDKGMPPLSKCKNLIVLVLADNPDITDRGIGNFIALKKLRRLNLSGTSVTARGVMQLKGMTLQLLQLPAGRYPLATLDQLHKTFPGTEICIESTGKSVDADTRALFAPLH